MFTRDTLLGLLVLALIAGGAYWVRGRGHDARARSALPSMRSATQAVDIQDRSPGPFRPGGSASGSLAESSVPDATHADALANLGDVQVTLALEPRPPVAFSPVRVRVRAEAGGQPVEMDGARISFEMVMPMGDHTYALRPAAGGWREAEVVLPMCQSGNPRWFAMVDATVAGTPRQARFRLDLAKP